MKYYKQGQLLCYIGTWMPFVILVTIFLFFYGVYMQTYLLPRIRSEYIEKPVVEINTYLIQLVHINDYVFSNSTVVITVLLHTILSSNNIAWESTQGMAEQREHDQFSQEKDHRHQHPSLQKQMMNNDSRLELIDKSGHRFCKNCQAFKPKRCHHCRQCKTCWLKMDHHCQWLNNCIGYNNYKMFINLLGYSWLLISFIMLTYSRCYYDTLYSYSSDSKLFLVSFTFLYCCFLWILLTAFTFFHLWAIKSNITTLEYCENKPRQPVQKSALENIVEVFGINPLIWFLPIQPNTKPILD
ncbi:unnamed protein product (macronuclear) [Paramecium tetraurelia]|uniref:Palmitoyltransferase n=1 Tax=Paramecium tetraurelia TaxID=5888 RepID=A0CCU1_PARTE|nr:uncharacterized protein GSPATT00037393001 [Paramecium tetraurelia]CAK68608.1 unnamed protein product [Paramecium tetraurelia]|eukprot:XP_001436005.1 hypothetical protein (macronuclear) [Paramecium tetraurelia strain d4-2]